MPNKIQRVRINSGAIAAGGGATAYSNPLSGRILAVLVNYPAATCTVDIDTDGEVVAQKIIDLAAANTDAIYYPRTPVCTFAGAETILYSTGNKVCETFAVNGRLKLTIASGTATQEVSVDIIYEEF